ncbi:hypothetical protein, partial [Pseudomonas aeruginosa]|uniref:hypothetical protein n=1 Tax=Pseudomonas aeruginosa TaxID=287 RepID=UPI00307DBA9C
MGSYIKMFFLNPGRETPSVAGIINPGTEGFQKLFFGQEEIAIPVHSAYVFYSLLQFFSICGFGFSIKEANLELSSDAV